MVSLFVKEQKRYTKKKLCELFVCSEEKIVHLLKRLKEFGVVKAVKASDSQKDMDELLEEDIAVSDVEIGVDKYFYVFTFVGIVIIEGMVLKCYPKYLGKTKNPKDELIQILKVLEKYNSKEQIVQILSESADGYSFNLLAVLLFFMYDYYENGVYNNTQDIVETNGSGEILWDKTINETFTLLSDDRPYYIELQTRKRANDNYDYFKRLHECILTEASKELEDADLLDLFEITEIDLSLQIKSQY